MKVLLILRGLPGSGKSTLANTLASTSKCMTAVCCADDYMVNDSGEYDFDPKRLSEVHAKCQEKAFLAMAHEPRCEMVIVSNTSTTEWEMNFYLEAAKKYGYIVHTLIVENRHDSKSIHNVPDHSLLKMKERFEVAL